MAVCLSSGTIVGVDGFPVRVEVDLLRKLPSVVIVGLPGSAVRESVDRVRSALKSIGAKFPKQRVVINLAPGDLPKSGTVFDLPIALGILASSGQIPPQRLADTVFVGELALDGRLCSIRGALPLALMARSENIPRMILPKSVATEAGHLAGLDVRQATTLAQVVRWVRGEEHLEKAPEQPFVPARTTRDLSEVKGQYLARRALEISAAGGHNLVLLGSPGCGKSMLANRIPGILPSLSKNEAIDITRIQSVAGLRSTGSGLATERPFRAPHHSISRAGMMGGARLKPGELSLAHHGVLFLDEMPEFARQVLELLRSPLEDGSLVLSRASGSIEFPCRVCLIASANPCPCGYFGHPSRPCICGESDRRRYARKLSGPLMDRMDLQVWVEPVSVGELEKQAPGECSARVRERVEEARRIQLHRYQGQPWSCNAHLEGESVKTHALASRKALSRLRDASEQRHFSARSWSRVLKVARTIADLEQSTMVQPHHVAEATTFRIEPWVRV